MTVTTDDFLNVIIYKDTSSILKDIEFYPTKIFDISKINMKTHDPAENLARIETLVGPPPKHEKLDSMTSPAMPTVNKKMH